VDGTGCPPRLLELLTDGERQRHAIALRRGRPGYGPGRVALRMLIGTELDLPPETIVFTRSCDACGRVGHGKPRVVCAGARGMDVSVATAGHTSVIALSSRGRVGVDIEVVPTANALFWPRPCFSVRERQQLAQAGPAVRAEASTRSWVRKEALAKREGLGLTLRLRDVEVTGPRARWQLGGCGGELCDVDLQLPLVAAVAHESVGAVPCVRTWSWSRRPGQRDRVW
jgi:phosphopantetheinyl transferase